ncbi:MAG: Na+-dependent transporter [Pseudolabrys sp.]|nr:Na+-dependent transporter [Pseudolabrys sp.]
MNLLNLPVAALAWLGRQGTRALAVSIFLGLAVPQLAASVKPYLGETVFVLLLFSYLRTDPHAFSRVIKTPKLAIAASLWVMVALPLLVGTVYYFSGVRDAMPALYTILILHCAIAPITSSAAFAAIMGLDVALSLFTLILCNVLAPVTSVAFSYVFLGTSVISPLELGLKLLLFFGGAAAVAFAIRRFAGQRRIEQQKDIIDGLNVIAMFIFAVSAMDGVPRIAMADPLFALKLLGFIVALTLVLIGASLLVFTRAGRDRALVIGLLAGFRNLGVIMAALGSTLPEIAWFYFALAQFPIYILPSVLKPLANRLHHTA